MNQFKIVSVWCFHLPSLSLRCLEPVERSKGVEEGESLPRRDPGERRVVNASLLAGVRREEDGLQLNFYFRVEVWMLRTGGEEAEQGGRSIHAQPRICPAARVGQRLAATVRRIPQPWRGPLRQDVGRARPRSPLHAPTNTRTGRVVRCVGDWTAKGRTPGVVPTAKEAMQTGRVSPPVVVAADTPTWQNSHPVRSTTWIRRGAADGGGMCPFCPSRTNPPHRQRLGCYGPLNRGVISRSPCGLFG